NANPSNFVHTSYDYYLRRYGSNNSLNGAVFEEIIIQTLLHNNILPIYSQCKMSFVPNVIFDIILYNENEPISLSVKTSLRERWKQADLEAVALKYIYRKAKCYLLSNSTAEVNTRKKPENAYLGLDGFVDTNSVEFDKLICELSAKTFEYNKKIPVFTHFTQIDGKYKL
ncbi:MAG: hypothetical protein FWG64_01215, partial [Firmicutes bacterium]|nr:hypothetical protein [Bacillota bacterium]